MDYLKLIKPEELQLFTENYNYNTEFMGQALFPNTPKTDNIVYEYAMLAEGQDIPVVAPVHALDTEAHIADRPKFEKVNLQNLFTKEKIDIGERIQYFLRSLGGRENQVVEFVFNDIQNLVARVLAREEAMRMELLSSGKITVDENNIKKVIDYGVKDSNKITLREWYKPDHDIIGDLNKIQTKARTMGFRVVRAITSSKVIGYIANNTAVKEFFSRSLNLLTEQALRAWLLANYGIEFIVNDDVYKTSYASEKLERFFDENAITFLATDGAVGAGIIGYTPEEMLLDNTSERNLVTVTMWKEPDAARVWTKASALYIPALTNINKMLICKVEAKA